MHIRLAPTSVTLDALERRKRPQDRPILLAAKCRPGDLFSRNVKYMRMFAGVPSERGVM